MVASVEECDASGLSVAWTRVGHRRVYSHADGGVGCVCEEVKGPGGAFVGGVGVGSSVCLDLYDERNVRWEEGVVGCLVEVAGRLVHWDGEDQVCAVVVRPGVEVVLDGQGGSGSAVGGFYGDVVGHSDVLEDRLGVVVESESFRVVCFLFGGADEGSSYEVAVAPSSYQFPVQVVVPVGDGFWERNEVWVRDLFGEEGTDCLYFFLRRGGSDVKSGGSCPAGGGDVGVAGGPAEEISEGFEDVVSHGGSPFSEHGGQSVVASLGCGGRSVVALVGPVGGFCWSWWLGGRAPGLASSHQPPIIPVTYDKNRSQPCRPSGPGRHHPCGCPEQLEQLSCLFAKGASPGCTRVTPHAAEQRGSAASAPRPDASRMPAKEDQCLTWSCLRSKVDRCGHGKRVVDTGRRQSPHCPTDTCFQAV